MLSVDMLSTDAKLTLAAVLASTEQIGVDVALHDIIERVPQSVLVLSSLRELAARGVVARTSNERALGSVNQTQIFWQLRDLDLVERLLGEDTPSAIGPRLRPSGLASRLVPA